MCCKGTALYIVKENAVTLTCEMAVIIRLMAASSLDDNDDDNNHNDEDCGSYT